MDAEELLARYAPGERLFCGAVLRGANLPEAALDHGNPIGADLRDANLAGALLSRAGLSRAELAGVILREGTLGN
jgi:uncharacterized protein YjbI with pentapeptide repeats